MSLFFWVVEFEMFYIWRRKFNNNQTSERISGLKVIYFVRLSVKVK